MIKVNIENNLKEWQILEDNEVIIRAKKPKWYSSEISFFFNGKTYQLKKKSFWKSTIDILQGGQTVGSITHSYTSGYKVNLNNSKLVAIVFLNSINNCINGKY